MNLFHKNKLETNIITLTPYGLCGKMCDEIDLQIGIHGTGFPAMTTQRLTLLFMRAFMAKGKMIVVPYPTFSPDLVPCLLSSPRIQYGVKGTVI